jgi:hypothetical protein
VVVNNRNRVGCAVDETVLEDVLSVMKWIIGFLLTVALFLSSYAVFKTTRHQGIRDRA